MSESDVLRACKEYLDYRGIYCWRQNQIPVAIPGGGYRRFVGLRGVSDILGLLQGGRFLAVEVKRPGGRLSPEQKEFLDHVAELGGAAMVVHSVDELEKDLNEFLSECRAPLGGTPGTVS